MFFRLIAIAGMFAAQACLAAPVYKVVGPDGKISFTDQMPVSGVAQELKVPVNPSRVGNNDRDPVAASINVYVKQVIVETGTRFCMAYVPQTAHAVVAARDAWRVKNGVLAEKKNKVLASLMSMKERNFLAENTERENERYLEKMRMAPLAEKTKWCEAAPARFDAQELNMSRNATLVRTIMSFEPAPVQ